jgi:hypothetical protein
VDVVVKMAMYADPSACWIVFSTSVVNSVSLQTLLRRTVKVS